MSNEKFCLRWNDFEKSISGAFKELRDDKDFFDVTLACEDNQLQAHKVILSACSPFFRAILRKNPHQHPLLYLKGVKYDDILAVLNFMYHGEVNVAQEELDSFLSVAEDLKVKGLTQSSDSHSDSTATDLHKTTKQYSGRMISLNSSNRNSSSTPVQRAAKTAGHDQTSHNTNIAVARNEMQQLPVIKTEAPAVFEDNQEPTQIVAADDAIYQDNTGYDEYDQAYQEQGMEFAHPGGQNHHFKDNSQDPYGHIKDYVAKVQHGTGFSCTICGKIGRDMYLMREHLEAQHEMSPGYTCQVCNQYSKNFSCLKSHIKKYH